jgi:hypothetical protein
LDELKSHEFFGGSGGTYNAILRQRPPPRVDRLDRRCSGASVDSNNGSFNFASSAECTPEVGQTFLSRKSADAQFTLTIQLEPSPVSYRHHELQASSPLGSPLPQPYPHTCLAPAHVQQTLMSDVSPHQAPLIRPDMSSASWHQWRCHFLSQQMLSHDESIIICGSVVRRKIRCMPPKVLMLTDRPRLLLLNASGLKLLREIQLVGRDACKIITTSNFDFELWSPSQRYQCYDCMIGSREWQKNIEAACAGLADAIAKT